jgi:hypothetical protein
MIPPDRINPDPSLSAPAPPPSTPIPPEVAKELALQLGGDLPCVRCKYNLRGLSVRTQCPECGLPIRTTVLAVVDPQAREFQPLTKPRLTALGILAWTLFGLAAATCTILIRALDAASHFSNAPRQDYWAAVAGTICILFSGIGALALVRPHAQIPRRNSLLALAGVLAYLPAAALYWTIQAAYEPFHRSPYLSTESVDPLRAVYRLCFAGAMLLIIVALRPSARLLWSRSFLMRSGRVDRQTMLALAAAVGVAALGDALHLLEPMFRGQPRDMAVIGGTALIVVGSMLQTLGLAGLLVDAIRLYPVIVEPSPTLRDLLAKGARPTPRKA